VPRRDAYQPAEVAELLGGVSERYVWKLISTGELRSFKSGARIRLVAKEDLKAYIDALREDELKAREAAAAS
jgi:excisionase family DNA binding protein